MVAATVGRPIPASHSEVRGGTDVPVTSGQSSEGARSQAGWNSEQPDLVKDVPSKAEGLDWNGL